MRPRRLRPVHKVADSVEVRLEKAILKALRKAQSMASISEIALAMANKNTDRALSAATRNLDEQLTQPERVLRDTVLRGGKMGARFH